MANNFASWPVCLPCRRKHGEKQKARRQDFSLKLHTGGGAGVG